MLHSLAQWLHETFQRPVTQQLLWVLSEVTLALAAACADDDLAAAAGECAGPWQADAADAVESGMASALRAALESLVQDLRDGASATCPHPGAFIEAAVLDIASSVVALSEPGAVLGLRQLRRAQAERVLPAAPALEGILADLPPRPAGVPPELWERFPLPCVVFGRDTWKDDEPAQSRPQSPVAAVGSPVRRAAARPRSAPATAEPGWLPGAFVEDFNAEAMVLADFGGDLDALERAFAEASFERSPRSEVTGASPNHPRSMAKDEKRKARVVAPTGTSPPRKLGAKSEEATGDEDSLLNLSCSEPLREEKKAKRRVLGSVRAARAAGESAVPEPPLPQRTLSAPAPAGPPPAAPGRLLSSAEAAREPVRRCRQLPALAEAPAPRPRPKPRTVWEEDGAKRPEPPRSPARAPQEPVQRPEPSRRRPANVGEQSHAVVREPSSGKVGRTNAHTEQSHAVAREPGSGKVGRANAHDAGSHPRAERRVASGARNSPDGDQKAALKSDRAAAREARAAAEVKAKAAAMKREQVAESSAAKLRDQLFCADIEQGPKSASEIAYENACVAHMEKVTKGMPKRGANSYVDMRERRGLAFGSRKL